MNEGCRKRERDMGQFLLGFFQGVLKKGRKREGGREERWEFRRKA